MKLALGLGGIGLAHGAFLLLSFLEPRNVFGVDHPPSKNEFCLLGRVHCLPLAHCFDHEHVLRTLYVLGIEIPLFELCLVLFLASGQVVSKTHLAEVFSNLSVFLYLRCFETISHLHLRHDVLELHGVV